MASPLMPSGSVPQVAAPVAPPTPDSATIQAAKTANLQAMMSKSGRQSTVLSGGQDQKLGG